MSRTDAKAIAWQPWIPAFAGMTKGGVIFASVHYFRKIAIIPVPPIFGGVKTTAETVRQQGYGMNTVLTGFLLSQE